MKLDAQIDAFVQPNMENCVQCGLKFRKLEFEDLGYFLEVRNSVRMNLHDNREFTLTDVKKWFADLGDKRYIICLSPVEEEIGRAHV
jgi:hypothetical protein